MIWTYPFPFYLKSGMPNGDGIEWKSNEVENRLSNENVEWRPYSHSQHNPRLDPESNDEDENDDSPHQGDWASSRLDVVGDLPNNRF